MEIKNIDYHFNYNKETKTFSIEISEWKECKLHQEIKLVNTKTGGSTTFKFKNKDTDSGGEDVYGWNYESRDGYKLLIIND